MKVLKYIIAFILLLALIFVLTGVFVPTFTYTTSVQVEAPVEKVWEVFTDQTKLGNWMEGFKEIKTISGSPEEVGSKHELTIVQNGEEMKILETVTDVEQNRLYAFDLESDFLNATTKITFEPLGEATRIVATNVVSGHGPLKKTLAFMFKSMMEETSQQQYNQFKKLVESEQ